MSEGTRQTEAFTCFIVDFQLHEAYSAKVKLVKKRPIWTSLQEGRIDLADVLIEPISDQLVDVSEKVHHHFVLYDVTGHGRYIVRDRYGRDVRARTCSIWDLGQSFALQVMEHLKYLT